MQQIPPLKNRLADHVVDAISTALNEGRYAEYLPGERVLAETFGVSRTMIRAGLKILARRGVVAIEHGKRTRIIKGSGNIKKSRKLVCLLAKGSMTEMSHSQALGFLQMQQTLNQAGFRMKLFFKGPNDIGPAIRRVRQLVQENPADCWVLYSGNPSLQLFFNTCGVPAYLVGRPCAGVTLPHAFIDYGPAYRHAVGKLIAFGHRRIALLSDETPTESHRVAKKAFLEACQSPENHEIDPVLLPYWPSSERSGLYACLDQVMHNRNNLPTAWVIGTPYDSIATLLALTRNGIRVPEDISIICLGYHPGFTNWRPRIGCYGVDEMAFTNRMAQSILRLAREGDLPAKVYSRIPEYIEGDSVAPPPVV